MNHKRVIQSRYDTTAEIYDNRYEKIQREKYKIIFKNLSLKKGEILLDVGCGTGLLIKLLCNWGNIIYGVDFSKKTLKKAQEKLVLMENCYLICGDAENLPFKANSFDKVFAITLFQNLSDPLQGFVHLRTICKPDGVIILSLLKKKVTQNQIDELMQSISKKGLKIIDEEACEDLIVIINNKK
ncbi:MAG: class I SAM-dependent methyltransferase [Candidatus Helarchaeota archaeon]